MRKILALVATTALVAATTASAITVGEPDGNRHPNVGALVADWNEESPGPDQFCTGTLVTSTLFLTAAHCMTGWGDTPIYVTFSPTYDEGSASPSGLVPVSSYVIHENFGQPGGGADAYDIAIVTLATPQSATPAQLPTLGLLDTYSQQQLRSLKPTWLNLSMNPSTGSGGTCYGDSGGPHFLGGMTSNLLVSLTVTGDAMCRATDLTYRLDTYVAQEFLSRFGLVPDPDA